MCEELAVPGLKSFKTKKNSTVRLRGEHFRFGFYQKKVTKPFFFFLKYKPKLNQKYQKPTTFGSVRFGFFMKKLEKTEFW